MKVKELLFCLLIWGVVACSSAFAQEDAVSRLKEEIIDYQNRDPLGFRQFIACSKVMDYGSYVPLPDNKIKAGDVIFFYFEPQNVFTKREEGKYELWYTLDMAILTEKEQEIYKKENALEVHYTSSSPRLDLHGNIKFTFEVISSGKYIFKATIHDKLKGADAEATWPFQAVK